MEQDNFDIGSTLRFVLRALLIALPAALLAAVLTYFLAQRLEPAYEATTTLLITQALGASSAETIPGPPSPLSADAYRAILLSDQTLVGALNALGVAEIDQSRLERTRERVIMGVTEDTRDTDFPSATLLSISYTSPSPTTAAETANALASVLISWDEARVQGSVERSVRTLEQQIRVLDENIASLSQADDPLSQEDLASLQVLRAQQQQNFLYARALISSASGLVSTVQPAIPPLGPVAPRPLRYAALAFVSALLLVLGCLLLLKLIDTRVRTAEDVRAVGGLPVLAVLEKARGEEVYAAMDLLRASVLSSSNSASKTLLVTSPEFTTTKAWLAAELAESFAASDYRTLLIDLDLAHPTLATLYNFRSNAGLGVSEYLVSPSDRLLAEVELGSDKRLAVLPAYEADRGAAGRIGRGVSQALQGLQERYDVIVISAPPVLAGADTLVVASACTDTLLVVGLGHVERPALREATERLREADASNLGAVALHAKAAPKRARIESVERTRVGASSWSARSG